MLNGFGVKSASFLFVLIALTACDSAEERADKHFESGLALIESGDTDRGLVELRNVLSLDEFHVEGRKLYARTLREQGNIAESYEQFRRLVESNPSDHESRLALAQMAIRAQNWGEVERHGAVLSQANVELDGAEIVDLMMRFRQAAIDQKEDAISAMKDEAIGLLNIYPNDVSLRQIIIEGHIRDQEFRSAVNQLDDVIELEPDNKRFYLAKARILAQMEELNELEDFLREMVLRFPDDTDTKLSLVRLYSSQGRTERAEEFLREIAASTGEQSDIVTLITFVRQVRGNDGALEEIDARLADTPEADFLTALKAAVLFEENQRDEAISLMEGIVTDAEPTDQINRYKVSLAKMLLAEGNEVGARTRVEEVLANDATQTNALKMSAEWLIQDDRPEEAIGQLRVALDQEPDDSEAMTLMSAAHLRMGDRELAQDLLSLAVEASNNAPEESVRFAQFLLREDSFRPAENVLLNALRNAPGNTRILTLLGDVYLRMEDWGRAGQIVETLRRQANEVTAAAANRLEYQILGRREGRDRAIAFLEQMAEADEGGDAVQLGLIRTRLSEGATEEAISIARQLVEDNPNSPRADLVLGNTQFAARAFDGAEQVFQEFVTDYPNIEEGWIQLSRTMSAQGKSDEARAVIDRGLEVRPDGANLLWAKASFLERGNDIDGAIEIYEQLYTQNSNSQVIANNLASLLATYREDDASLERAYNVGRRLRGTEVAPFQDTYGWILHRRGEYEEAVTYLEPAAAALGNDPIVQYHLGMTYLQLGRSADAAAVLERAIEIAGDDDPRPQIARARAELEKISTPTTEN